MKISTRNKERFRKTVWDYYILNKRSFLPWRKKINPYRIWISEIMLQQTQVDRVIPFFKNWMDQFPTVWSLATASQSDVLRAWKGLGYNSRALRIKRAASEIVEKRQGVFPRTYNEILELPGIGSYTAGAIMAFTYNQPVVMIETNIRRVFINHFFSSHDEDGASFFRRKAMGKVVHDKDILNLIQQTLPIENFREWYWALMDYGSYLGKTIPNPNKKSRHYTVQKKFKGSDREIRGKILDILLHVKLKKVSWEELYEQLKILSTSVERIKMVSFQLEKEGFLEIKNNTIFIKK